MKSISHVALLGLAAVATATAAERQPNIVIFLADDLGYGGVGCYGAPVPTPHIDRLAAEGVRCTDAHAPAAVCCPTRYGLLTGRYPWRVNGNCWALLDSKCLIEPDRRTMAAHAQQAGYATMAIGKWHLGFGDKDGIDFNQPLGRGPVDLGFQGFLGSIDNLGGNVLIDGRTIIGADPAKPFQVVRNKGRQTLTGNPEVQQWTSQTAHERFLTTAEEFIAKQGQQPFLLYFASFAVHQPLKPRDGFTGSRYGAYADYTADLDDQVGRIRAALEKSGVLDDTILVFTSDNGANEEPQAVKAGLRVNAPLQGSKSTTWEAGHRVPLIVRYPGKIPAGTTSDALIGLNDLYRTTAALAGLPAPTKQAAPDSVDVSAAWCSGGTAREELVLVATGCKPYEHALRSGKLLFIDAPAATSIAFTRGDKMKHGGALWPDLGYTHNELDEHGHALPGAAAVQLYDLATDPGQTRNLAAERPDEVTRLRQRLHQLLKKPEAP
jgi:arylsulfatase A-like enzyme